MSINDKKEINNKDLSEMLEITKNILVSEFSHDKMKSLLLEMNGNINNAIDKYLCNDSNDMENGNKNDIQLNNDTILSNNELITSRPSTENGNKDIEILESNELLQTKQENIKITDLIVSEKNKLKESNTSTCNLYEIIVNEDTIVHLTDLKIVNVFGRAVIQSLPSNDASNNIFKELKKSDVLIRVNENIINPANCTEMIKCILTLNPPIKLTFHKSINNMNNNNSNKQINNKRKKSKYVSYPIKPTSKALRSLEEDVINIRNYLNDILMKNKCMLEIDKNDLLPYFIRNNYDIEKTKKTLEDKISLLFTKENTYGECDLSDVKDLSFYLFYYQEPDLYYVKCSGKNHVDYLNSNPPSNTILTDVNEYEIVLSSDGPLGITVENIFERTIVINVKKDSPAELAGAKINSKIIRINDIDTGNLTHREILYLLSLANRPLSLKLRCIPHNDIMKLRNQMAANVLPPDEDHKDDSRQILGFYNSKESQQSELSLRMFLSRLVKAAYYLPKAVFLEMIHDCTSINDLQKYTVSETMKVKHRDLNIKGTVIKKHTKESLAVVQVDPDSNRSISDTTKAIGYFQISDIIPAFNSSSIDNEEGVCEDAYKDFLSYCEFKGGYSRSEDLAKSEFLIKIVSFIEKLLLDKSSLEQPKLRDICQNKILLMVVLDIICNISLIKHPDLFESLINLTTKLVPVILVSADNTKNGIEIFLLSLISQLSINKNAISRVYSLILLPMIYATRSFHDDIKLQLRALFDRLLVHDPDVQVRRAAAFSFPKLVDIVVRDSITSGFESLSNNGEQAGTKNHEISHVTIYWLLTMLRKTICIDDPTKDSGNSLTVDNIRMFAIDNCVAVAKIILNTSSIKPGFRNLSSCNLMDRSDHVFHMEKSAFLRSELWPIIIDLSEDKYNVIRQKTAESLPLIFEYFEKPTFFDIVFDQLNILIKDPDNTVKAAAIKSLSSLCLILFKNILKNCDSKSMIKTLWPDLVYQKSDFEILEETKRYKDLLNNKNNDKAKSLSPIITEWNIETCLDYLNYTVLPIIDENNPFDSLEIFIIHSKLTDIRTNLDIITEDIVRARIKILHTFLPCISVLKKINNNPKNENLRHSIISSMFTFCGLLGPVRSLYVAPILINDVLPYCDITSSLLIVVEELAKNIGEMATDYFGLLLYLIKKILKDIEHENNWRIKIKILDSLGILGKSIQNHLKHIPFENKDHILMDCFFIDEFFDICQIFLEDTVASVREKASVSFVQFAMPLGLPWVIKINKISSELIKSLNKPNYQKIIVGLRLSTEIVKQYQCSQDNNDLCLLISDIINNLLSLIIKMKIPNIRYKLLIFFHEVLMRKDFLLFNNYNKLFDAIHKCIKLHSLEKNEKDLEVRNVAIGILNRVI